MLACNTDLGAFRCLYKIDEHGQQILHRTCQQGVGGASTVWLRTSRVWVRGRFNFKNLKPIPLVVAKMASLDVM